MRHLSLGGIYNEFFHHEDWNVGIVCEPITAFLKSDADRGVHWLPRRAGPKFLADPFGIARGGTVHILCEEFDYRASRGRIVSIELREGTTSRPRVALDMPFHTSHPFLFESGGEIYCVPETSRAREISLYTPVDFPHRWKKAATLVSGFAGSDNAVFQHEGCWWLTSHNSGALFVWYSPDLFGPWRPHEPNPVKIDLGSSRPGGTPFMHDGFLYRPAQDCSRAYGGRIVINRVTRLAPTGFAEEKAAVVEPCPKGPYPDGLHTLSAVGDITLVDGSRHMFIKSAFKHALFSRIRGAKDRHA